MSKKNTVQTKRIYEDASAHDGYRILVDRLWPRGISKEAAQLDEWNKTVTPSSTLRKWFAHREDRFKEFEARYRDELKLQTEELDNLKQRSAKQPITLLYAAKNPKTNHAIVLAQVLREL